ncbi:MAG: lysine--tRNA ligase [Sphaerospermopsis sp. SIO1G2]|nr:lysine--tRNA ligase [Sphaerospermopsis sp. SIO1G2]
MGSTPTSWAFKEAQMLQARYEAGQCKNDYVLFETGYGPSGLPHIGTFGEVARTMMVMRALRQLSPDIPVKLICFSDDMDGLRKIPDNIPNPDALLPYLNKPLTSVIDPFGTHESYGHHMNAKLRSFLDAFGFAYKFVSATDCYKSGRFDEALCLVAARYQTVMDIMLPTLGQERQRTYSPFLPISPSTGHVLYVPMTQVDADKSEISFTDEDGTDVTLPVTGGHCKLQWKPDFGMRWAALGVDFEMYGKDHQVNGKLYSAICRVLGGQPPQQFAYELFLDQQGQKISKSKGNGITIDEWLAYAPQESLALYMFQSPKKAKRLYFDVIPRAVDEYITHVERYHKEPSEVKRLDNPAWAIHGDEVPKLGIADISFSLLLNLASACNPEDKAVLWGFIQRYLPDATPATHPFLDQLAGYAVRYYEDFVKAHKQFRAPNEQERSALQALRAVLSVTLQGVRDAEQWQSEIYRIGREHYGKEQMRDWFAAMYETLLGATQGPRMGSFIALYGSAETITLIDGALSR